LLGFEVVEDVVVGATVEEAATADTSVEEAAVVGAFVEVAAVVGASVIRDTVEGEDSTVTTGLAVMAGGGFVSNEKTTGLGLICLAVTVSLELSMPKILMQVEETV